MSIAVGDLGRRLPGLVHVDAGPERVDDVEHDSRRVRPGALFACIRGAVADGHDFATAAAEAGATALLVDHRLAVALPQIVVSDVRAAVGPAAAAVHGEPSHSLSVIGVTGTNGKTTTVSLVGSLVRQLGHSVREIGTLTGERTTPEAPELQRQLAAAVADRVDVVAMEVSSHALDQHRVDGTRYRVAAFTNLGVDHLDHHGDLESYYRAKARLFTPGLTDLAVIDCRSDAGRRLADETAVPVVAIDDETAEVLASGPAGTTFRWRDEVVELPIAGAFNVSNALLAAEIMTALGHEPDAVAGALASVPGVPGRFESVDDGQAFSVVVDYAHTPDGLEAVLEVARAVTDRALIVVFGAGGDRDRGKRPQMGEVARRLADRVVVTSDNPRNEPPEAIISAIVSGMDRPPDLIEPDRRQAIRHAIAGAREGDLVLIAGKGHETTQTIGDDVLEFDDRVVVREELRRAREARS